MAENRAPNYPDILGYITKGKRLTVDNVVDVAIAVHPQVARAGRPFEVIAVMQNITDVNLQVTAVLQLPKKDSRNASDRFLTKTDRLSITVHPAETGYLVLPVTSQVDTAPGDYKVGVEFEVKPLDKPRRIRQKPESNQAVNLQYYFSLSEESAEQLATLKSLPFSDERCGRFCKGVEGMFRLGPGNGTRPLRSNPEWISLWSLGTDTDVRPLLERYHTLLAQRVLPALTVAHLYDAFHRTTRDRLFIAGYPIREVEVHYIVKLMIAVLEMGRQPYGEEAYPGENMYRVAGLLQNGWPTDGRPIPLPNWCRRLLYTIGFDDRVLANPIEALARPLFEEVMRDAIWYGFKLLHSATDVDLGDDQDIRAYADQVIKGLWEPDVNLDFIDIHMPMVFGGLLVDDRVKMASEDRFNNFHELLEMYETREEEYGDDVTIFFDLALHLVDSALQKHGFWSG